MPTLVGAGFLRVPTKVGSYQSGHAGTAVVAPGHARRLWDGGQHRPRFALAGHGPALPRAFGAESPRLPTKVGSYQG